MRLTSLTLALCMATTCAQAQSINPAKVERVKVSISDTTDKFTGTRTIGTKRGLELGGTGWLTTLALSPGILAQEGKPPIFFANVYYDGYGWVFLDGRAFFVIDGQRYSATGTDSSNNRTVSMCGPSLGCSTTEIARIVIGRDLAHAIANAKDAEIKVTGSKGSLTGRLNDKHVAYFREMAKRYEALGGTYFGADEATAAPHGTEASPLTPATTPAAQPAPATNPPYEADPAKRCDACKRIGNPSGRR